MTLSPRLRRWLLAGVIVVPAVGVALSIVASRLGPIARDRVEKALEDRFDSDVELKDLSISLFPNVRATGSGLILRHKRRTDVPPIIQLDRFEAVTGFWDIFSKPVRVSRVTVQGLQLHTPPKRDGGGENRQKPKSADEKPKPAAFLLEELIADGTRLEVIPKTPGKDPLVYHIAKLKLTQVARDRGMKYDAVLTNAKPPGQIQAKGEFGPWETEEPGDTPLSGDYRFRNADLSVFKGIAGILASDGKFTGVLERIDANGSADVPDFQTKVAANKVHLQTEYHAIIDGTNGETLLQPVDAHFLNSSIHAEGGVVNKEGLKGKTVELDATVNRGRLEEILLLGVKASKRPMRGIISFKTKLVIPPGDQDVIEKLYLNGDFGIGGATFTSLNVQNKVETLSRRSQGQTDDTDADQEDVVSNLKGHFVLKNAVVTFTNLTFTVPGAFIQLSGTYGLRTEELDFRGTAKLDAKLSQMTTGFKSFLLKMVDPFFKKKDAGAVLPIRITGTRDKPSFGLALGGDKKETEAKK